MGTRRIGNPMFNLHQISPSAIVGMHAGACASYLSVVKAFYCGEATEEMVKAETVSLVELTRGIVMEAERNLCDDLNGLPDKKPLYLKRHHCDRALAVCAAVAAVGRCYVDTYDGSVARVPLAALDNVHRSGRSLLAVLTRKVNGTTVLDNCYSAISAKHEIDEAASHVRRVCLRLGALLG